MGDETATAERLGKSSSFKAAWTAVTAAGAGFTQLQGTQQQKCNISAHFGVSGGFQFVVLKVKRYMGGAAVAPKAGKSSSPSPGLELFIVLTVKENKTHQHSDS